VSSIQSASNPSADGLTSLSATLATSYSSSEVITNSSMSLCQSSFSILSSYAKDGYLQGASFTAIQNLVDITSNFVSSSYNVTTDSASVIDESLSNIGIGILRSLSNGQYPVEVVSDNLKLSARKDFLEDLSNISFTPPQTDAEIEYGVMSPSMSIQASDISSCNGGDGYSKIFIGGYGQNPFPNSTSIRSTIFRITSSHREVKLLIRLLTSLFARHNYFSNSRGNVNIPSYSITRRSLSNDTYRFHSSLLHYSTVY
jgi:hypothetical protein